jgi:hypothetical protein
MSDPTAALSMPKPQMVRAALLFHFFPYSHMYVLFASISNEFKRTLPCPL